MSELERRRAFLRSDFEQRLYQLCIALDNNIIRLDIHWVDHEEPYYWDSVDSVTIRYINNFDREVNCKLNSITATAKAVIDTL